MFKITQDTIGSYGARGHLGTVIDQMPLYWLERAAGLNDALPGDGPTVRFRLLDDDGEVYYEGELTDDDECKNQSAALRWGEADAGCSEIQVWRDGGWKTEIG